MQIFGNWWPVIEDIAGGLPPPSSSSSFSLIDLRELTHIWDSHRLKIPLQLTLKWMKSQEEREVKIKGLERKYYKWWWWVGSETVKIKGRMKGQVDVKIRFPVLLSKITPRTDKLRILCPFSPLARLLS